MEKKILNGSGKIMETLLGKTKVIRNCSYWYHEEIVDSFSEIISMKLEKNYEEILEKLRKNITNASHRLWKNILMKTEKFSRQFLEEFTNNCTETSNNFEKNCRIPKKILKIFGAFLNICPEALQSLI